MQCAQVADTQTLRQPRAKTELFPTRTAVRDIVEKLIMAHLIEEFPAFYVTARFIGKLSLAAVAVRLEQLQSR